MKIVSSWLPVVLITLLSVTGLMACSSDSENIPEPVSETISAAEGGSVATADNTAKITIPAGALAEDTEISIEAESKSGQPEAENLGSAVFNFGPDGLQFAAPVTIELKLDDDVPDGKVAVLAVLEDDKWSPISGSALSGNSVMSSILRTKAPLSTPKMRSARIWISAPAEAT
jgi:hypothetical protein